MAFFEIDVDDSEAKRILKDINKDVANNSDNVARDICEEAKDRAERELMRQGSVGTGKGINSFVVQQTGANEYSLLGMKYLKFVDTGTRPHRPPLNNRLIAWAESRGIPPVVLADAIEEGGTRPNPWINRAFRPLLKTADERATVKLKRRTRL
ncbi:MAG: hypothetical protein ABEJ66_01865 [Candidatus Nanohaloarchaea archaeon]